MFFLYIVVVVVVVVVVVAMHVVTLVAKVSTSCFTKQLFHVRAWDLHEHKT